MVRQNNQRSAEAEKYRPWYSTARWQKIRAGQLAKEPLCRKCKAADRITVATVCDHVEPHRGDPAKFWNGPFQIPMRPGALALSFQRQAEPGSIGLQQSDRRRWLADRSASPVQQRLKFEMSELIRSQTAETFGNSVTTLRPCCSKLRPLETQSQGSFMTQESSNAIALAMPASDPIFELIGLYKGAAAAHDAAIDGFYAVEKSKNAKFKALGDQLVSVTSDHKKNIMRRICSTRPATLAGAAAMAEVVAEQDDEHLSKIAFKSIAAACRSIPTAR